MGKSPSDEERKDRREGKRDPLQCELGPGTLRSTVSLAPPFTILFDKTLLVAQGSLFDGSRFVPPIVWAPAFWPFRGKQFVRVLLLYPMSPFFAIRYSLFTIRHPIPKRKTQK